MSELPYSSLKLAVLDCIRVDKTRSQPKQLRTLAYTIERLWREDPATVSAAYLEAIDDPTDGSPQEGQRHGLHAERMKAARRPLLSRDRKGLSLSALALQAGIDRETLAALMEKHEYIITAPYGRTQSRRLCTDAAFKAGVGHNVDPSAKHSLRLDGMAKSAPFAVFYPECIESLMWTLDWLGITLDVSEHMGGKRGRVQYALEAYGWLPNAALAGLCGCTTRGIEKARVRLNTAEMTQPIRPSDAMGCFN